MSAHVLLTGALFKKAELRTSSSGRRYARATIKAAAADNSGAEFYDLMVFSETAAAELQRLDVGERLAVQGSLKTEIYAPEGKPPRISRTIFVDHVLALRAPPKQKKAPAAAEQSRQAPSGRVNIVPPADGPARDRDFDDDIPF